MQNIDNYTLAELQNYIDNVDTTNYPVFNIAVLRNITIEGIEPYLRFLTIQMGFRPVITYGGYDNVLQDALGNDTSLINDTTDCIMIFTRLETLSPKLASSFAELSAENIEEEKDVIKNYMVSTLKGIRNKTNAMINWHAFEIPVYPAFGVMDHTSPNMQVGTINELNDFLKARLREFKNGFFIDINISRTIVGYQKFYDSRYWHIGKAPYTLDAVKEIANENFKLFRALKGKNKKCLVLDCDNTLWGGILGEDGMNGIKIGPNYPGSAYMEFQQEILSLYNRGIIIALCSKNNESDVWDVIDNHPAMLLKRNHISIAMINWEDKASNIKQIASTLNIGLDSIVFVDDNEFETNLVKELLPSVETIHLPKGKSADYKHILSSSGLFDNLAFTEEDKVRGQMYKAEIVRKQHENEFDGDIEQYYKTLNMHASLDIADGRVLPRIAQLTQKTNQFNLTTRRYTESDIEAFINSKDADIIFAELEDRFGNMGIVGCCIVKYTNEFAEIDTFLLSCRVIGRGLEKIMLNACIGLARKRNIPKVIGSYIATNKNSQVKDFYTNNHFIIEGNPEPDKMTFSFETSNDFSPALSYFKEITINF